MKTICNVLEASAKKYPQNTIYDFLGYKRSYRQFINDVETKAYDLKREGLMKGDIVTICLPNIPEALVLFYALNKIGCTVSFIHPQIPLAQYKEALKKLNSKTLFILNSLQDKLKEMQSLNIYKFIYTVSVSNYLPFYKKLYLRVKELSLENNTLSTSSKHLKDDGLWKSDDTAVILFSGGTTGTAKAIELTNENVNSCATQTASNKKGSVHSDKMLAILPLFHGYGLISCVHTTISEAHQLILLPYYEEKLFAKTFQRAKPNYINGIPKLYKKITPILDSYKGDLSFLKGLFCGGSHLDDKIRDNLNDVLLKKNASLQIQEGYGLTEMGGAVSLMPLNVHKKNSIGLPFNNTHVMVVDHDNKPLGINELGRLCFSSPAVMKGYLDTNYQPFFECHQKQWLITNDIGYLDEEGYIYYVGRTDRIVKISGYEVHPASVEKVINEIDGVSNSCVVPLTIDSLTVLKAFVVANHITSDQIKHNVEKHLPRWSIPKEIEFIDAIPQSLYQKNDYNALIDK